MAWVLTSYEGQQRLLGVTETQSRRIEEQDKHIASLNERISQINQQIAGLTHISPDLNDTERTSVRALTLAPELWAKYGKGVCLIAGSFELVEPGTANPTIPYLWPIVPIDAWNAFRANGIGSSLPTLTFRFVSTE